MKKLNILIIALLFVQIQMYSQTKTKVTFGGNAAYHIGTGAQKDNTSPFLFFKNGQSAGLDLTLVPKTGTTRYKLAVDYIMGTNDESAGGIADFKVLTSKLVLSVSTGKGFKIPNKIYMCPLHVIFANHRS
jgi:hypothetical protein